MRLTVRPERPRTWSPVTAVQATPSDAICSVYEHMFAVAPSALEPGTPPWLEELNAEQRAAATHPGGPLLVIASAGTGKTTTLCARVAWLLTRGVPADRILLLTFTRRAARELLDRAAALVAR